jgi:hypothetical protein
MLAGVLVALLPQLPSDVQTALDQWRQEHGQTWHVILDEETLKARTLFNGRALAESPPESNQDWFTEARHYLEEALGMFGVEGGDTLIDKRVLMLPLGMVGGTDKVSVRLVQKKADVPVTGGAVNALFDMDGNLLCLDSDALPGFAGFNVEAEVPSSTATAMATNAFFVDTGVYPDETSPPSLTVAQLNQGVPRSGVLVWVVDAGNDDSAYRYLVAARGTASIVLREQLIHELTQQSGTAFSGTVSGNATVGAPGWFWDNGTNFDQVPLGHLFIRRASNNSILTTTNADGTFLAAGGMGPMSVALRFQGPFVNVCSLDSPSTEFPKCPPLNTIDHKLLTTLTPSSGNNIVVNPAYDELITAQANAFYRINQMRGWIRAINPMDDTFDENAPYKARPNRVAACGGFYDGMKHIVNFARKDVVPPQTCAVNFAYSVVVWHEMGHWMNDVYGHGNSTFGFGEGAADVWAMYQTDYSEIVGTPRSGTNTRCFCGECPPCHSLPQPDCSEDHCQACHGGSGTNGHTDGQVLMGALWKVRQNLKGVHGDQLGKGIANALLLGWMNAFSIGRIKNAIAYQWAILDDDDGILGNSSSLSAIHSAFLIHEFPGILLPPVRVPCP